MTGPSVIQDIKAWWQTEQQKHFDRSYSAELISVLRDEYNQDYISSHMGRKLYKILKRLQKESKATLNFGVNDVFQYHACSEAGMETAYVSGGLCSISDTPTGDVGADMADYPYTTVPSKVDKLVKSALHHEKIDRINSYYYKPDSDSKSRLVPIIADADSGHGGLTSTLKLAKLFVEAGAAAIHIDDQVEGTKKFKAKTAGRVMVPVSELVTRMKACKLQFDIMGSDTLLFHRTDAETAGYLTSTIDPLDKPFVLGKVSNFEELITLSEAVQLQFPHELEAFERATNNLNLADSLKYLRKSKLDIDWDHDSPRSPEGWYRYRGCVEAAIARAIACLPYSDLVWSRTAVTDWKAAEKFAVEVQKASPGKLMGYNVFPIKVDGCTDFVQKLADMGYIWQFWPMAGLESAATEATQLAQIIKEKSMEGFYERYTVKKKSDMLDKGWHGGLINDMLIGAITDQPL